MTTDPMPHLLEIKGQLGSIQAQLQAVTAEIPSHSNRITSLEHDRITRDTRSGMIGAATAGLVSAIGYALHWIKTQ
jgi:hypothetical protein